MFDVQLFSQTILYFASCIAGAVSSVTIALTMVRRTSYFRLVLDFLQIYGFQIYGQRGLLHLKLVGEDVYIMSCTMNVRVLPFLNQS